MGAGSESVPNLPESQPEAGPLPEVIVQQVQLPAGVAGPTDARAAADGASIRGLRVIHTPGHTQGHISLLHESDGLLFVGDAVGTMNGVMVRPPALSSISLRPCHSPPMLSAYLS
jgi:glyoxylase-like metal-dependent hydrolase (beta-lactamase superfamily II)